MGRIQELSESLANQIAAGEVVERPASVVKELVENAIDAGSTQIDILLEEAGLKKIQIIDNGEGIAKEDVGSAFKRHATSKIHTRNDLFRIRTLGFRGEALPSIASVSEVTLETAVQSEDQGSFLSLKGGKVVEERPSSLRKGTKITVENLFFNTPARLKYVKSLQTELANVGDIVNRLALSHPEVAFRLVHDGNRMLTTPGNGDLKQCIAGIYGVATAKKMREIKAKDLDFTIHGYFSLPEVTRASRNYLSIIINGRYIKNFLLNRAIIEGYGSKLMVGRFPIAIIEIQMDPLLVDVNVHPTKQEVRLSKEKELSNLISATIKEALTDEVLIPKVNYEEVVKKSPTKKELAEQLSMDFREVNQPKTDLKFDAATGEFYIKENPSENVDNFVDSFSGKRVKLQEEQKTSEEQPTPITFDESNETNQFSDKVDNFVDNSSYIIEETVNNESVEAPKSSFPALEYFGQMHGTYLFAQSNEGLYIIDQHAAQERIKYEYYREAIGKVGEDLQSMLIPIVLEYPHDEWLKITERQEILAKVGIHLEPFGANSFIVREHPTWYEAGKEEDITKEIIEIVLESGQIDLAKFREDAAIMMSCKRSIKANHYLNDQQARALLVDLGKTENPFNCPHGRPVLIQFTNREMERMFKRIQDSH
ncbi:DNA mismatch repair protein MutL [Enterococcus alcedinis]|uniref:DNA mismatch repair protein MutL n=1 Tax=Enterococcus alcedinis TaxID=1274384 RepID=A0A917JIQ2_9ENTE|nr:DNA mismatch repair endonuclease MutL [Enterococcus alcedinis]MBP2103125.1 DNA mismatch repair protein MutL [Enterococcus alcedinis]GGI66687.1 DNA mismatch repair protein MutL [Enterococcus alcedinis]